MSGPRIPNLLEDHGSTPRGVLSFIRLTNIANEHKIIYNG